MLCYKISVQSQVRRCMVGGWRFGFLISFWRIGLILKKHKLNEAEGSVVWNTLTGPLQPSSSDLMCAAQCHTPHQHLLQDTIATSDTLFARCDTNSFRQNLFVFGNFWKTWKEIKTAQGKLRKLSTKFPQYCIWPILPQVKIK